MLTLYDYLSSGNGFKVRLLLSQLRRQYRWVERDIMAGATRTPDFLAKNPNGRIPLLETDGMYLAESNAILFYLADGTVFLPQERMERAQVLQWMFFEQYSHEPYVAVPRFILKHLPQNSPRRAELPQRLARGRAALGVMDQHLNGRQFMVAERYSIADIALYAYTHVAEEGSLDLTPYRHLSAWLKRVAAQPNYTPITLRPPAS
ncbi:MAG: glutathione S-transferase family protein [Steroidobacteraceae bacterium]